MPKTPLLIAIVFVSAWSCHAMARGGQGGPIGPGSRDGLTPSASDYRPNIYRTGRPSSVVQMRPTRTKRK